MQVAYFTPPVETKNDWKEAYINVLQNNAEFYSIDNKKIMPLSQDWVKNCYHPKLKRTLCLYL